MDTTIIITTNSNKKNILKELSQKKILSNLKFYTMEELKKKIFFDYDNKTLEYVMTKYHVSLDMAEIYLANLYFLKEIDDHKVQFLNTLKTDLEEHKLLIKNPEFLKYINRHHIIIYGYNNLSQEQQLIIKELKNIEIKLESKQNYLPKIYEAKTLEEEALFVINKISELITTNIDLNKIKIIAKEEYYQELSRLCRFFNIPINIPSLSNYYSTFIAQEFLSQYPTRDIEDIITELKEKYDVNDLITIINKSASIKNPELRLEFIIQDLKNTPIKPLCYDKSLTIADTNTSFNDDDYVFWLGLNINNYPQIKKDEDYLSDKTKSLLGIDTSIEENLLEKKELKEFITGINHLTLTYKLHSKNGVCYPSLLINEIPTSVEEITINNDISYSIINSKLKYAKMLDDLYKYNIKDENLVKYQNSLNIPYREYNHTFGGINQELLKKYLNKEINLAYTSLETYNECAFKYYLTYILHLNKYEENFKTILGSITHDILEEALKSEINIPEEIMRFVKENQYELGPKEYFYLEKLSEELGEIITIIKKQNQHSQLNNYLFEELFNIYKDKNDYKITFQGLIDKVMYKEQKEKLILVVVDYKTGKTVIDIDNIKYGIHMQLPIYLYLLKNSPKFHNAIIGGFYIQQVLHDIPLISNKSLKEVREENLRLQGYTNSDEDIIALIDDEYMEGKVIKGLKGKKDGTLNNYKVLDNEQMQDLTNLVDSKINETLDHIMAAKFTINPKMLKNRLNSCEYCLFKDICFKTKEDEIIIGDEYYEVNPESN